MPLSASNGSIKLRLLRTLATVATISTAPYYTASAQPSPTLCSCSPRTFNFKLNFAGNCESTSLTGVSDELCFVTNRPDDDQDNGIGGVLSTFRSNEKNDLWRRLLSTTSNQNQRDLQTNLIPTSVELVEIFEVDSSNELNVINQEEYNQNFSDGDEFQFTSISSKLDPNRPLSEQLEYFPNGFILVLVGVNSDNERVRNTIAWKYNIEDCSMEQITPGDYIGWINVADDTPASGTFCPAAKTSSPTQSPTLSFSPTIKPTVSPVVATNSPSVSAAPVTPPTPSGWGSDGYGHGEPTKPVEKPSTVASSTKANKPSPSPVRTLDPALPEEILDWHVTKSPIYNTAPSYKPTNSPHSKPSMCEACPNGITVDPSTQTEFGNTCGGISAAAAKYPADSKTCARIKAFESKCCPSGGEETTEAASTEASNTTAAATTEAPMTTTAATTEAKPSSGEGSSSGGGGHGFEDSEYKPSKPSKPSGEGWSSGGVGHKPMCEACPDGISVDPSTQTEFGNKCGGISAAAAKWPADSKTCARIKAFESKCCPIGGEETTAAATTEAPMTTTTATTEAKPSGGGGSSGGGHGFEDSEYKPSPSKPSQPSGEGWSSGEGGHRPSMCEACPNGITVDPSTQTEFGNKCGGISAAAAKWPADSKTCARIKAFESKCCPSGGQETTAAATTEAPKTTVAATTEAPMTTTAATTEAKPSGGGSLSGGGGHGFEDSEYEPSKPSQPSGEGWSSGGGGNKPSMCEACPNGITVDPSTHTEYGNKCGGISAAAAKWPADSKTCARIKTFESKCCPSGGQETTEAPVTTTTATTEAKPSGGVGHGFEDSEYKPSPSKPAKPSGEGWSSGGGHHKPNSTGSKSVKHMSIFGAKHGKTSESSMSHGLWASSEHTKSAKHDTTSIVHTKSAKSEVTKTTKSSKVNGLSWASQHTKSAKHSDSKAAKTEGKAKSAKSEGTKSAKAKHLSTNMSHQVNDKWSAIKEHARYVYNNW